MRPAFLLLALLACSRTKPLEQACDRGEPDACEVLAARYAYGDGVPKDGSRAVLYATRASDLCKAPGADRAKCALVAKTSGIPVDPPAPATAASPVLTLVVFADGKTTADGAPVADDEALRALAQARVAASPDLRAVIKADKDVPHGRVIQVLDTLKQAGVTRIAFGVTPI